MTRHIKFRAWCGFKKVMIPNYCFLNLDNQFEGFDLTNNIHGITSVMQYTGLKDKNGVEIYEGDIVVYGEYKTKSEVSWNEGLTGFFPLLSINCKPIEVIGNIHQNPELL